MRFSPSAACAYQATVIGGAALQLMGVIDRPTKDCDVLDPELPPDVVKAADDYAATLGGSLSPGWFNNGPISVTRTLPADWTSRVRLLYSGEAIVLRTLGREDLLRSKLFALVDRNIDQPDCVALKPARQELHALLPWLDDQDGNEQWPDYVRVVLGRLAQDLGYEL
ncbi:MAG: DUF6036 family nucleotidyltransferase [Myxococcales bacterium]|nr:DUF6036 family nucleotidyltransferase [Myxococcales bacterium]